MEFSAINIDKMCSIGLRFDEYGSQVNCCNVVNL